MNIEQSVEVAIATMCEALWPESKANKMLGLLEETLEVLHASGEFTEEEVIGFATRMVKHTWSKPSGVSIPLHDRSPNVVFADPHKFFNELRDVRIMLACLTATLPFRQHDSLTGSALEYMSDRVFQAQDPVNLAKMRQKTAMKTELGIRLPG
jgi:hypothetical protein